MPLNTDKIRSTVLMVAEPGPRAEYAVRTIIEEATRYAAEQAGKAPAGSGAAATGLPVGNFRGEFLLPMRESLNQALAACRGAAPARACPGVSPRDTIQQGQGR